jgi:hypothetical protein
VVDPDLAVIFGGTFAIVVGFQLARGFNRRAESRGANKGNLAEIRQRLDAIERAVDSIAIEVERGGEAQRFMAKLVAERPERLRPGPESGHPGEPLRESPRA